MLFHIDMSLRMSGMLSELVVIVLLLMRIWVENCFEAFAVVVRST
jgi:hypothetical protein